MEAEKEEAAMARVGKGNGKPRPIRKEDQVALPGCTREGVVFILECKDCRDKGIRRQYVGETSRSRYQRAGEHQRDVEEGTSSHPMNVHFAEEHQGLKQETLFRLVSKHQTALEPQVMESDRIKEISSKEEESLNLKS